jgi:hypothetical protein
VALTRTVLGEALARQGMPVPEIRVRRHISPTVEAPAAEAPAVEAPAAEAPAVEAPTIRVSCHFCRHMLRPASLSSHMRRQHHGTVLPRGICRYCHCRVLARSLAHHQDHECYARLRTCPASGCRQRVPAPYYHSPTLLYAHHACSGVIACPHCHPAQYFLSAAARDLHISREHQENH